jgi:Dolichyl-phosphate-mannose-protein mannosyltransferase
MMQEQVSDAERRSLILLIAGFALLKLMIHLVTNIWGGYGYFRDELYYIACSNRLDAGYVDQPPFSLYVLAIWRFFMGDSIFSLRLLPALAGAATVFITGLITMELGGRRYAIMIACLSSVVSLIYLAMNTFYSMNAFDVLLWAFAAYLMLRLIQTGNARLWLVIGVVLGIGMMNKISVLWLGAAIGVALLITPQREWLKTRWPYLAALIAVFLFLPYVIWNVTHDYAHLEFIRNASTQKYSGLSIASFLTGQVLIQNPVTIVVWVTGIVYYFATDAGRPYRPLGLMFLIPLLILLVNGTSKPEYLSPAYAVLFAGGGVYLEQLLSKKPWTILRPVLVIILVLGFALAPAVLPILPVETYIRYADALGVSPSTAESKKLAELPQFYADMFGWEEKAAAVAKVYNSLPAAEKDSCVLYAVNYGRCGAMEFFGKKYGLPPVYGSHNNYWLWGPPPFSPSVVIILGGRIEWYEDAFSSITVADSVTTPYAMPYENNLKIFVCREPTRPIAERWPQTKHYE